MAAYVPKAAEEAERPYPEALADCRLILAGTKEEATGGADALVICTPNGNGLWRPTSISCTPPYVRS